MSDIDDIDGQPLKKAILFTLSRDDVFDMPMTTLELFELLTDGGSKGHGDYIGSLQPIKQEVFSECLKRLVLGGRVFLFEDHVSVNSVTSADIQSRENRTKTQRSVYREAYRKTTRLSKVSFIRGVFIDLYSVGENKPTKIIVCVDKSRLSLAKQIISLYMKFVRVDYQLDVRSVESLVEVQIDLTSAYAFLQIVPLINKEGLYEKYVHKNTWVFSFFPNYPFQKVSMGYRVVG